MSDRKVNCFLIGAQKAGSTTFHSWLSQHPDIDAPIYTKDLHFFINEEALRKGERWYEGFYGPDARIRLDTSVNYLFRTEVPLKIYEYNPQAKIILILRDPAKRAFSAYQFFYKLDLEKKGFKEALKFELEDGLSTQKDRDDFGYISHGFYYQQLSHWLRYFHKEQIMILFYEELFKYPEIYFPELLRFLGLNTQFFPKTKVENRTGRVRYKWLNGLVYDRENSIRKYLVHNIGLKKLVPISWKVFLLKNFRDLNTRKGGRVDKITVEEYEQLHRMFQKDTNKLSSFLKKDLSIIWRYYL